MKIIKPDAAAIRKVMDQINGKYGDGTIFVAGKDGIPPVEFMPTGLPQVDLMFGGGIPKGKIIMMYGPEGAGKSSFCMHVAGKYPLCAYIDAERSFSEERSNIFGVDLKKTILVRPKTGEQALSSVIQLAALVPLIIIDSVAALVPKKEFDLEEDTEDFAGMALTAGLLSRKIFAINNQCDDSGCTVIIINQIRDNFRAMRFGKQTSLPGGHALKYAAHVIFEIARKETLKQSGEAVGILCRFSTETKNRSAAPFQQAEVPLIFDRGFVQPENMKDEMKEARKRSLASGRSQVKDMLDEEK